MKPDWKDAPKWANWLAQDGDGEWYWYEREPVLRGDTWVNSKTYSGAGMEFDRITEVDDSYKLSLEKRP